MRVFVCISTTVNGLITAGVPHDEWVSCASWKQYLQTLSEVDAAVVGSRTYKVMADEEFPPSLRYVVLTHDQDALKQRDSVTFSRESPTEVIGRLRREGRSNVVVLGGAEVIRAFLRAELVDELLLDVQGIISGSGKNMIATDVGVHDLELLDTRLIDPRTIQLRYKVMYEANRR